MIVQIKTRAKDGKFANADPSEFIVAAMDHSYRLVGGGNGWSWVRDWLARWCLMMAERVSCSHKESDRWIERYRALRSIE